MADNRTFLVSYSASGGNNAPNSQYKQENVDLTLSSDIPTSTGHTFKGWATSYNGLVKYQPGDTYVYDQAITLYAVWQKNVYTITYDAYDGYFHGNTSLTSLSQRKWHGVSAHISNVKPVKKGYVFEAWDYKSSIVLPGSEFTKDEDCVLHAIWKPIQNEVPNIFVNRCFSDGTENGEGTCAKITIEYIGKGATINNISWRSDLDYIEDCSGSISPPAQGQPGQWDYYDAEDFCVEKIISDREFKIDRKYYFDVKLIMNASTPPLKTYTVELLPSAHCYIDVMPGSIDGSLESGGMGIGKEATRDGVLDIGYKTMHSGGILHPILSGGTDLNSVTTPNTYILDEHNDHVNCPDYLGSAMLTVERHEGSGDICQIMTEYFSGAYKYERFYSELDGWTDWKDVTPYGGNGHMIIPVFGGYIVAQWGTARSTFAQNKTTTITVNLDYQYADGEAYFATVNVRTSVPHQISSTVSTAKYGSYFKIYCHTPNDSTSTYSIDWMTIGFSTTYPSASAAAVATTMEGGDEQDDY